jgi:hypothetical protein
MVQGWHDVQKGCANMSGASLPSNWLDLTLRSQIHGVSYYIPGSMDVGFGLDVCGDCMDPRILNCDIPLALN